MTCPSCGGELDPSLDRCPVCDAGGVPRTEGALAADPRLVTPPARPRVETLRDIPGLRKAYPGLHTFEGWLRETGWEGLPVLPMPAPGGWGRG